MRAEWVGSAGATAVIRCPCGARAQLPVGPWRRRGFTICDRCKAVVIYGSLKALTGKEAEDFMAEAVRGERQRQALREELERELRRFVRAFDSQEVWQWSPATVRLVEAVRPRLELLGPAAEEEAGGAAYVATPEAAFQGDEDEEHY